MFRRHRNNNRSWEKENKLYKQVSEAAADFVRWEARLWVKKQGLLFQHLTFTSFAQYITTTFSCHLTTTTRFRAKPDADALYAIQRCNEEAGKP